MSVELAIAVALIAVAWLIIIMAKKWNDGRYD